MPEQTKEEQLVQLILNRLTAKIQLELNSVLDTFIAETNRQGNILIQELAKINPSSTVEKATLGIAAPATVETPTSN